MHFFRLLRNALQLCVEMRQRILQAEIFIAIFFQELRRFSKAKRPSPGGISEKKNCERSRTLR